MPTSVIAQLGERAQTRLTGRILWSREVGIARTLLAVATWGTLVATPADLLLREPNVFAGTVCSGPTRASVFCVLGTNNVRLGQNLALLILLVVASGWRARFTCIPHWWVSWSVIVGTVTTDGGDQVTALLTLFLIPLGLTDRREWHWTDDQPIGTDVGWDHLVAASSLIAIQVQIAVIYLYSGISKFAQPDWANGTAVYYWLLSPRYGVVSPLRGPVNAVLTTSVGVVLATYAVMAVEVTLGFAWASRGRLRRLVFIAGVVLHVAIAIFMGIPSFSVTMIGAVVLYLLANDGLFAPGRSDPRFDT